MKKNILNIINKKVAGRAEGIEKVESYLVKTEKFNEERKALEAKERAERIAELDRLAAQRQAERDAELELYCAQKRAEEFDEPETPVFKKIKKQTEMKPSNFQITPLKADYLEKQLAHMKVDHLRARNSDFASFGRGSGMTQASTMNTTINADEDNEMPFAMANSVKHTHKKSLMLAANNMLSPKSTNPTKLSMRKGSVTFESSRPASREAEMRATTMSFRNQELDRSINEHIKQLTRPQASIEKDSCLKGLKEKLTGKVNLQRRSNLDYWDRPQFDQELKMKDQTRR